MAGKPRRSSKRRYTRKPVRALPTSRALVKMIKNVSLKNCETKTSGLYITNQAIRHGATYYFGNLLSTRQGVGDQSGYQQGFRLGDEIIARGLSLKFHCSNPVEQPNVIWKIFVYRYKSTNVGAALNDTTFWCGYDGSGSAMARVVDTPNTEHVKILKKMTIQHQPNYAITNNVTDHVGSTLKEIYIPLNNQRVKYDGENSNIPRFTDIAIAVTVYDAFTTLPTDTRGFLTWSSKLYFKDP